ncbi:DUF1178 family protein [Sphingomonas sp. ID1715]|uniref:DUF1178 family protein n=1 Tax=Sphingomonas sp. ID1715 TaxID=1656898 RepID=UPI0014898934|nr:DUF1178 family protein [Sphingomonas sp. ID1715]NNM76516.1 DUF1178 family protein [Sphingomonas sp. ID1715]
MIVFDLKCGRAHVFEAWFGSSTDYEDQRGRGLIQCPICGDVEIGKAVMAPRLGSKVVEDAPLPVATSPTPEVKAMLTAMAQLQARMLEKSEWVGRRFADEARAIHLGETEHRTIHGEATPTEAAALADEGIAVAPLPFPIVPPDQRN